MTPPEELLEEAPAWAPRPVPTSYVVEPLEGLVMLGIRNAAGSNISFPEPAICRQLAAMLINAAAIAEKATPSIEPATLEDLAAINEAARRGH